MTRKIGDTPKPAAPVKAKTAKATKKRPAARAKAFGTKKPAAAKQPFPRTTWQDTNKLGDEIGKSQAALSRHPRIVLSKPNNPGGGTGGTRPPIQARYGGATPRPPIQAKYGVPTPGGTPKPPIQAKYGVPTPGTKPRPPIQAKYGVPTPTKPPIQAKYGVPTPNKDTQTKKA